MEIEKYTVLTYIFGKYESVKEIKEKSENAEYILVTDNHELSSNTWTVVYDETLEGKSIFDKCYEVRFNPFKYASNDIVMRIDGSIEIRKNLDGIISKFIKGNYDISLMIHPERKLIHKEYAVWSKFRGYDIKQAQKIVDKLIEFGYDFEYKGLYQGCFVVQRKNKTNTLINAFTLNLLKYFGKDDVIERLDQTIFSAVINKMFSDINVMPVGENLVTNSSYFKWYTHVGNFVIPPKTVMTKPFLFNEQIELIEFE